MLRVRTFVRDWQSERNTQTVCSTHSANANTLPLALTRLYVCSRASGSYSVVLPPTQGKVRICSRSLRVLPPDGVIRKAVRYPRQCLECVHLYVCCKSAGSQADWRRYADVKLTPRRAASELRTKTILTGSANGGGGFFCLTLLQSLLHRFKLTLQ